MLSWLVSMALLMLVGLAWRRLLNSEEESAGIRQVLTRSVYLWFLPALVLHLLWQAGVDQNTLHIPALASACILASVGFAWLLYRLPLFQLTSATTGALLLASGFGNFTYLGLPVLSGLFGEDAGIIAIQFDLLAATPLLFSFGIVIASHYGHGQASLRQAMREVTRVPALWAACGGLILGAFHVPCPR